MATAIIYARISKDIVGESLGVSRQERACRDLAGRLGLDVVDVLVDNDVSAYRRDVRRPGFEALVEALKADAVDAVVVYHADRLYRRMADLERLVTLVEATGVDIHTVAAGDIDLSTASGRMIARMLGAAAQHESERIGERSRLKQDELAASGRPPGGRAPYGYRHAATVDDNGKVTRNYAIEETEAAAVRTMATRLLEGASLLGIARELEAAGVKTREGRPWHQATVRSILMNPAIAGLRIHRREPGTREAIIAGPGTWAPILDRAVWEQVRATVVDPARKRTRPARKHLLAGLVVNQLGERMNGSSTASRRAVYRTVPYVDKMMTEHSRQSLQIGAEDLEAFVVDAVLTARELGSVLPPSAENADSGPGDEIGVLEAELAELAELRGKGTITISEWLAARPPLLERIAAARKSAGATRRTSRQVAELLAEPTRLRKAWPNLTFDQRREILGQVVEAVIVGPATRAKWTTVPERVEIRWRS